MDRAHALNASSWGSNSRDETDFGVPSALSVGNTKIVFFECKLYACFQKNDFYMDALPHYGLNGSELSLNNLSFDGVKDILSTPISCWGGTSFNAQKAEEVANTIGAYFENVLID